MLVLVCCMQSITGWSRCARRCSASGSACPASAAARRHAHGRDGVSLDGHTIRRRDGEGVVAKQDKHVVAGEDDDTRFATTVWHTLLSSVNQAVMCVCLRGEARIGVAGRRGRTVKKSQAPAILPCASPRQRRALYRSSVPVYPILAPT